MNIRVAQLDDIETLFAIRTSVVENHQSREEIAELGITPETVAELLITDCCAWIVEINNRSVGFSIANAAKGTIFGIFVIPEFESRGVGRALMQEAEKWLWSKGIEEIWLLTGNDSNLRAYGFYRHLHWIPVGVEFEGNFQGEIICDKLRK